MYRHTDTQTCKNKHLKWNAFNSCIHRKKYRNAFCFQNTFSHISLMHGCQENKENIQTSTDLKYIFDMLADDRM